MTAWGSCQEGEGAPAYWSWIQILRDLDGSGEFLVEHSEGNRFRLFDQMIEVLRRSSAQGLLVVLDDLQGAELASLRLLQILAAEIGEHGMLLLGLYRRLDADSRCAEVLSAIARERATVRLALSGLSGAELARLAEMTLASRPEPVLVRAVADRSEGNPFFALALLELVREAGALGRALPSGVREAIGRRLDTVSADTRHLLQVASVLGREFAAAQLAELAGQPVGTVLGLLDEALARELVMVRNAHTFRFAHALIQEVAYAELPLLDRQQLHQRAVVARRDLEPMVNGFAVSIIGCTIMTVGRYLWRGARRRGWWDRLGRFLIIGGYFAVGAALVVLTRFILAAMAVGDPDESARVLLRGLATCLAVAIPGVLLALRGLQLAKEQPLMEAEVQAGF